MSDQSLDTDQPVAQSLDTDLPVAQSLSSTTDLPTHNIQWKLPSLQILQRPQLRRSSRIRKKTLSKHGA